MSRTINFAWDVQGVPTDVQSVVASDAGATYGVVRADTNASVVAAGTAFTKLSAGRYAITFAEPVAGLTYSYSIAYSVGGVTIYLPGTLQPLVTASGRYTNLALLQRRYGTIDVLTYSDTDATGTLNVAAVKTDIDNAEDELDSILANLYVTPLVTTDGQVPSLVAEWATEMTCERLYTSRGIDSGEDKKGVNPYTARANQARSMARAFASGQTRSLPMAQRLFVEDSGPVAAGSR